MNRRLLADVTCRTSWAAPATLWLVITLGAGGCFSDGYGAYCQTDADCYQGLCTRTSECVPQGSVIEVRIFWTLYGVSPTAELCEPTPEFRVTFEDLETGDNTTYQPVPCTLGQMYFDRMPGRFDQVKVSVHDVNGWWLDEARFPLVQQDNRIDIDFQP